MSPTHSITTTLSERQFGKILEHMGYVKELNQRRVNLRRKIRELERMILVNPKPIDPDWLSEYDKLSELRLQYATVESRIANLNKPRHLDVEIVISNTQ